MRRQPVAIVLLLVAVAAGCGGGSFTDHAHRSLNTALAATNAARDEFVAWDKAHQLELVDAAATKEAAEAALTAYRSKREPVLRAFTITYTTIAAAAAMIPLVDRGIKKDVDLLPLLSEAATAAMAIKDAYKALRGDSP